MKKAHTHTHEVSVSQPASYRTGRTANVDCYTDRQRNRPRKHDDGNDDDDDDVSKTMKTSITIYCLRTEI
jgi:hypothetical protein